MSDKDYIKEIFSEKLGGYQAKVNPELWNGIASQIGTAGVATTTGLSIVTKWMIGLGVASVVVVGVYFITPTTEETVLIEEVVTQSEEPIKLEIESSLEETEEVPTQTTAANQNTNILEQAAEELLINEVEFVNTTENTSSLKESIATTTTTEEEPSERKTTSTETTTENTIDEVKQEVIEQEQLPEELPAEELIEENVTHYIGALPNVFTPNGDGNNDVFSIESENLTGFHVVVLNDKNQQVFESSDPRFIWDGTKDGTPVKEGRYVYFITAKEFESSDKPKRYSPLVIKR